MNIKKEDEISGLIADRVFSLVESMRGYTQADDDYTGYVVMRIVGGILLQHLGLQKFKVIVREIVETNKEFIHECIQESGKKPSKAKNRVNRTKRKR